MEFVRKNNVKSETVALIETVVETNEEVTTEDTRTETDKVGDSIVTTVATEATTVTAATGIVQSVKIQTSHSVPNAIGAESLAAVEAVDETMTAEAAETTEDTRAETDKVDDSIGATETTTVTVATGIVQSVKIQTSHSEPNATDVVHHEVEEGAVELVETPAIALGDTTLEDDLPVEIQESAHHEEKASDHQEGTVETDVLNVSTKAVVHTTKIVLKATSVNQYAKPENHAHFANPEETDLAMPTTDLRNH